MPVRGIRGATTTQEDSEVAIIEATSELLAEIARENALDPDDIAAARPRRPGGLAGAMCP